MRSQNKLLLELRKQHGEELKHNVEFIKDGEKRARKIKDSGKRRKRVKHLRVIKKRVVKKIKKKQRVQVKEFKSLRGKKNKSLMDVQLAKWKNEGYKLPELKREMKISEGDIKSHVKRWKEQGYNTKILKKK